MQGPIKTYTKVEKYSIVEFLAYMGGLLGVFAGVSVLSIIELVYFSTIHLFWKVWFAHRSNTVAPANDVPENIPSTSDQNMYLEDIEQSG